jgi:anti-sigma regulatory factor (Ser/Thr protein kinase)
MSTMNARVDLPPIPIAVRAARRMVSELLTGWEADQRGADVALLVSEVVTNAVDHAGGEASLELELSLSQGWLRVSLADGSSIRPQIRELDPTDPRPRGRGMRLVERIAHRWGCEDHHGGKRVWFELDTTAPAVLDEAVSSC